MKTKENKNEPKGKKSAPTIEQKKKMPKGDGYGNIPTIGENENWSGYPDW